VITEHLIVLASGQPDATSEWGAAVPRVVVEMLCNSRRAPDERWVVRTGGEAIRRGDGLDLGNQITRNGRWIATAVTTDDGVDALREWAARHPEVRLVRGDDALWQEQTEAARGWASNARENAAKETGDYPSAYATERAYERHHELGVLCDRIGA
jgi:hypothetical protein